MTNRCDISHGILYVCLTKPELFVIVFPLFFRPFMLLLLFLFAAKNNHNSEKLLTVFLL